MFNTVGPVNTACYWLVASAVLAQGILLVGIVVFGDSYLESTVGAAVAKTAHGILVLDVGLSLFNLFFEDGSPRPRSVVVELFAAGQAAFLLQLLAVVDQEAVAALVGDIFSKTELCALRLLALPALIRAYPPPAVGLPWLAVAFAVLAELALVLTAVVLVDVAHVPTTISLSVLLLAILTLTQHFLRTRRQPTCPQPPLGHGAALKEKEENAKETLDSLCANMVRRHQLFFGCVQENNFVSNVLGRLQYRAYLPGASIVAPGESDRMLLFVVRGGVKAQELSGCSKHLGPGSTYEFLVPNAKRTGTLVTTEHSDVFCLQPGDLEQLSNKYPKLGTTLMDAARQQLHQQDTAHVQACFQGVLRICCGIAAAFFFGLYALTATLSIDQRSFR